MAKILVLGDTHIHNHQAMGGPVVDGINSRCRDIVRSILTVVQEEKPDSIVQLGDFFDVAKPPPAVLDLAMRMIRKTEVPWYILAGNHDISTIGAPTAIRPLSHLPNVRIFEEPEFFELHGKKCLAVPYCSLSAKDAVNRAFTLDKTTLPDYAFLHYGLAFESHMGPDYIDLGIARDRPMMSCLSFHGHDHCGYWDEDGLNLNVGSFAELRFGELELTDSCYTLYTDQKPAGLQRTRPIGPVFLDDSSFNVESLLFLTTNSKATSVYLRVKPDRVSFAQELKSLGFIQDYAVQRQTKAGPVEQYAADFEKVDPLTTIAQVIVDRLEVGNMEEEQAIRVLNLAKKELQL